MAHYKGAATEATRAMHIMKRREKAREELEIKKRKVEEDIKLNTIDSKFATHYDAIESQLRSATVGLVTLEEMRQRQMSAVKEREKQLAHKDEDLDKDAKQAKSSGADRDLKRKALSFAYDDDDDDDDDDEASDEDEEDNRDIDANIKISTKSERNEAVEHSEASSFNPNDNVIASPATSRKDSDIDDDRLRESTDKSKRSTSKSINNLDIDTSFLPDREREEEERLLREKLAEEWRERQRKLKEEEIEITFSYWDGSGHRRQVRMKKGNSIYQFLQACLETLHKDFNELRNISADQLVYVKEDLIIPHHYTFYDFIVTKARGKSGPLFSFDVHDDVRLIADATVEKDESHAGKVLLRSWYERNKHIFPASRWEPFDPTKTYEKYTISDKRSK